MEPKIIDYDRAFLKLNISGKRYKILKSTASRLDDSLFSELVTLDDQHASKPKTGLGMTPAAASSFYMMDTNEFYFERSAAVFDYVLHYAYTGRLHCPSSLCKDMLIEELEFWRLVTGQDMAMAACCQNNHDQKGDTDEMQEPEIVEHPRTFWGKIWLCCEDPSSSKPASILNIVSILFIVISIVNLVLSTVKALHHCPGDDAENSITIFNVTESSVQDKKPCEGGIIFEIIEGICIGWFTLELLVRFISCPNKGQFFKSAMNIIDLLATLPFYIELVLEAANLSSRKLLMIYVFRLLRILRIMRALRLARYLDSIRIMGETFKKCRKDLSVLLVFIFMAMIISSSVIYYFERDEPDTQFTNIPTTFWWCIVTLTTVGYGDMFPTTSGGRVFAGVVCVAGIILMAMPISIMVEQFSQTYKHKNMKAKRVHVKDLFKLPSNSKLEPGHEKQMSRDEQAKLINEYKA